MTSPQTDLQCSHYIYRQRSRSQAEVAPHVFFARSDDGLVNVNHRHELGLLLEQLVQQRAVPAAEDEDLLVRVVVVAVAHQLPRVAEVGLGQVHEAVQHEAVAEVLGAVDLDQLVRGPLGEQEPGPVVLEDPIVNNLSNDNACLNVWQAKNDLNEFHV